MGTERAMTMLLDVSRLRSGGVDRLTRRFDASQFPPEDEFRVSAHADLNVEVHKDGRKVRLAGTLATVLTVTCSRCLEPFPLPVENSLDLFFMPAPDNRDADEREIGDEDLAMSFYRDDAIDLGEVMREQFYLALPMKPLCKIDCLGLCPVCGVNRNRESCQCQTEWVDPRLEGLKRFIR